MSRSSVLQRYGGGAAGAVPEGGLTDVHRLGPVRWFRRSWLHREPPQSSPAWSSWAVYIAGGLSGRSSRRMRIAMTVTTRASTVAPAPMVSAVVTPLDSA